MGWWKKFKRKTRHVIHKVGKKAKKAWRFAGKASRVFGKGANFLGDIVGAIGEATGNAEIQAAAGGLHSAGAAAKTFNKMQNQAGKKLHTIHEKYDDTFTKLLSDGETTKLGDSTKGSRDVPLQVARKDWTGTITGVVTPKPTSTVRSDTKASSPPRASTAPRPSTAPRAPSPAMRPDAHYNSVQRSPTTSRAATTAAARNQPIRSKIASHQVRPGDDDR